MSTRLCVCVLHFLVEDDDAADAAAAGIVRAPAGERTTLSSHSGVCASHLMLTCAYLLTIIVTKVFCLHVSVEQWICLVRVHFVSC